MKAEKKERTTSKDWLKLDMRMQEGAIWTDEKSNKGEKSEVKYKPKKGGGQVLRPDPVKYGNKVVPHNFDIIE